MIAKGLRRLEILVPECHPIFTRPPGARAMVAREWLDLGARLSAIERELRDVKKVLSEHEPAKKAEHEAEPGKAGAGNSVRVDDFI